jgi:predicted N-acetyltransferase YhbS
LRVYADAGDQAFAALVSERGYARLAESDRVMSQYVIADPFPEITTPEGFRLQSLADENDLHKVDRVLHRGFNHEGEPSEDGWRGRLRMQSGPYYRKDLTIAAVAPSGGYVSYCGMWFEAVNRFGYVEPVATDPDYRRRGLGRAVVLEGIRRCGQLGATVAYVGTDKPFYRALGFRPIRAHLCWVKTY